MTRPQSIAEEFRLGAFAYAGRPEQNQPIDAIATRRTRIAGEIGSTKPAFSIRMAAHRRSLSEVCVPHYDTDI